MYRYLAAIWMPDDPAATVAAREISHRLSARPQWFCIINTPGMFLFHSVGSLVPHSNEARKLSGYQGAICGRAFRRGFESERHVPGASLDENESSQIIATRGEALIERYWGRYVAFLKSGDEVLVLREPSGALPCYTCKVGNVRMVFSDIESCLAIGVSGFSVDWTYIAAYLAYPGLQICDTGLEEVSEIQPGERLAFRRESVERTLVWNPQKVISKGRIESFENAVLQLRATVQTCVRAWASLYQGIIHNLSGGLDSSIVLSCLIDAPTRPAITCLNYFASASKEDERRYARLAAKHFGAELVEHELRPGDLCLDSAPEIRLTPKPSSYVYDLECGVVEAELAQGRNASAIFSGSGGDGLFFHAHAELAVADFLHMKGFSPSCIGVSLDAARVSRLSIAATLVRGIKRYLVDADAHAGSDLGPERTIVPMAIREAVANDAKSTHPWLRDSVRMPPGFRFQVLCNSIPAAYYRHITCRYEVERVSVLFSQPLIELCLRIPSYLWISGGRDRAVARAAFAADLPSGVVNRTHKGTTERHVRLLLDRNAHVIRETLMDGLLVARGLLDKRVLEFLLSSRATSSSLEYTDVINHYCTEMWVQRWTRTADATTSSESREKVSFL